MEDVEIMMRIGDGTFRYDTIKSVSVVKDEGKFRGSRVKITFLDTDDSVIVDAENPEESVKEAHEQINQEISRQVKYQQQQQEKMQARSQLGGAPQF